jgi:hypothetical protein
MHGELAPLPSVPLCAYDMLVLRRLRTRARQKLNLRGGSAGPSSLTLDTGTMCHRWLEGRYGVSEGFSCPLSLLELVDQGSEMIRHGLAQDVLVKSA